MCLKAEKSEDKNYITFNYDVKDGGNKTKWDYSVEDQIIIYDGDRLCSWANKVHECIQGQGSQSNLDRLVIQ